MVDVAFFLIVYDLCCPDAGRTNAETNGMRWRQFEQENVGFDQVMNIIAINSKPAFALFHE